MTKSLVSAMVLAALAGAANAQTLDIQIVERNNQTVANAADNVLDFAVRARVNGGGGLGAFGFNAIIPGEADTAGTLAMGRISNNDGTYSAAISTSGAVGLGGLARSYTYLATIDPSFNGLINTTGGTFTNTAGNQEIGLITGSALRGSLLGTPGVDPDGNNAPATWSGYGTGTTPAAGTTAPVDAAIAAAYFAQGQFIDIYRFRYTVNDLSARTLTITVQAITAQLFTQFLYSNGSWGLNTNTYTGAVNLTPWTVQVTPAPASAALLGLGGLVAARRRRA